MTAFTERFNEAYGTLQKAIKENDRLEYFKRELTKILDKQLEEESGEER